MGTFLKSFDTSGVESRTIESLSPLNDLHFPNISENSA